MSSYTDSLNLKFKSKKLHNSNLLLVGVIISNSSITFFINICYSMNKNSNVSSLSWAIVQQCFVFTMANFENTRWHELLVTGMVMFYYSIITLNRFTKILFLSFVIRKWIQLLIVLEVEFFGMPAIFLSKWITRF